jgi:hypothetical protein
MMIEDIAIGSRNFTNRLPFRATANDLTKPWSGGKNGVYFRCYLCGHKFKEGDIARWQYTNDTPGAGGNPMVCQACDGPRDQVIEKWRALNEEYQHPKFWSLRRR